MLITRMPAHLVGPARQSPVPRLRRVASIALPVGHSQLAWLECDVRVGKSRASTCLPISEGTDPLSLLATSWSSLLMAWATMEAANARHDGTQDHRAAVGSGSSPRRPEV